MIKNISNAAHLLTNFFLIFCAFNAQSQFLNHSWGEISFIAPNKAEYKISFAVTDAEKTQGLSGLKPSAMLKNQGLLFIYNTAQPRVFWMPDTYFDLDIIFMDKDFKVVGLEENVKHHVNRIPEHDIVRTKSYHSQYILELHAGEANKAQIKKGSALKLNLPQNLIAPELDSLKTK